mgnify:CR=1 FL=1
MLAFATLSLVLLPLFRMPSVLAAPPRSRLAALFSATAHAGIGWRALKPNTVLAR